MITKEQYEFFSGLYEDAERTYGQLEARGNLYLGIIAGFLATVLLKADGAVSSANSLGVPWWAVLVEALLFAGSLLFVLLALRIRSYEAVNDPQKIVDGWKGDGPSNEEFYEDRIADYVVAASRNAEINNQKATMLSVAGWLLVVAMLQMIGIFAFALVRGTTQ